VGRTSVCGGLEPGRRAQPARWPACPRHSAIHIRRNRNPQNPRRPLLLLAEEIRHPQQEYLLPAIFLVNDRVLLIEVTKRLRQLKRVPRPRAPARPNSPHSPPPSPPSTPPAAPARILELQLLLERLAAQFRLEIGSRFPPFLEFPQNIRRPHRRGSFRAPSEWRVIRPEKCYSASSVLLE
jgi:hypothetical protein